MATMNVSLPDEMRRWVDERSGTGTYANASDYVRDLIRRDQKREAARAAIQNAISEGLESGDPRQLDREALKRAFRRRRGA
ncbi:type II toxin-antitoxin system ParD family antitoxin [Tranquillimonas alkanivorans]|uniref:Antitoxin ParD1/3/4 n=1 Tax=Tranquillimonas alkanivorans TaxID=441119 RepID=A0A1I5UAW6_9RHOB|nr:type II toxin-antitoxin system ParD family antitoxin [Tranquillimonas alkanivorans]SFP92421.1 antitoxin ParD1/3/4 [Tranquillimonas alkanivorans]